MHDSTIIDLDSRTTPARRLPAAENRALFGALAAEYAPARDLAGAVAGRFPVGDYADEAAPADPAAASNEERSAA